MKRKMGMSSTDRIVLKYLKFATLNKNLLNINTYLFE